MPYAVSSPGPADRLIRCRCVMASGMRCELLFHAPSTCAAICTLLDAPGVLRVSARLA